MNSYRRASQFFLFIVSFSYLYFCPHSKVEESFSLQAVHDLFYHGIKDALYKSMGLDEKNTTELPYDHLQFPGVVPRSFVAPAILAAACQLVRLLLLPFFHDLADHPLHVQFLARFLLLCFFLNGFFGFAAAIDKRTKRPAIGTFLLIITAAQFHMPFYASRMLPNIFATILCLHAYSAWVQDQISKTAICIIVTTAVFRCDVILLLFTGGLSWIFVSKKMSILQALRLGVVTGIVVLAITVPLDSILWRRPLWPEGEVFFFNTILNKSSEWGVSVWHFYLSSALPKSMVLTLPLVPLAIIRIPEQLALLEKRFCRTNEEGSMQLSSSLIDTRWLAILLPAFSYVFLYSFLGHKETRFLFPVMPLFNMAAAIGLDRIYLVGWPPKGKTGSSVVKLAMLGCTGALFVTFVSSLCFVAVSHSNYPGGDALYALSQHVHQLVTENPALKTRPIKVYIDVASAMSGVSLFGQRAASNEGGASSSFHKSGYEEENAILAPSWSSFTYLLTEEKELGNDEFREVKAIQGNPWLDLRRVRIGTRESIYIRERIGWQQQQELRGGNE